MKALLRIFLVFLLPSATGISAADGTHPPLSCPGIRKLILETDETVFFCQSEKLQLSRACYEKGDRCAAAQKLRQKLPTLQKENKISASAGIRNPGSKMCDLLAGKVVMGRSFDGSDTCVCQFSTTDYAICTSLL